MCQFVPQAKGGGWGWQETGVAPESDRMKPSVCESFCLTSMTPCSCEEEVWIGISFDLELKKYDCFCPVSRSDETCFTFNDTLGSWNTFFHLLSVVISMRSGKTTLRGWRRKSLTPRIGSIGYFVCLFYLSHLFDIRFFWHLAKFVEPLLNPMDMFPMWGIPLQGNGYRNGFRHVSTKEWMISYRILKNYVLLNVSLNKSRLFKWEQSFEGFQWLRLMKITWLWSHDFDRDIGSKLSFNAPCVRAMVGRQGLCEE